MQLRFVKVKTLNNAFQDKRDCELSHACSFISLCSDSVMSKIGIKENAQVVDLTKREGTASTLLESKIVCEVHEKV